MYALLSSVPAGRPLPALLRDHSRNESSIGDTSFVVARRRHFLWDRPAALGGGQKTLFVWVKQQLVPGRAGGPPVPYFAFLGGAAENADEGEPLRYRWPSRRWCMPLRFQANTGRERDYPLVVPPRAERWLRRTAGLPVATHEARIAIVEEPRPDGDYWGRAQALPRRP
jgi:hypothetical protein